MNVGLIVFDTFVRTLNKYRVLKVTIITEQSTNHTITDIAILDTFTPELVPKWQNILNLLANFLQIPSALITRIELPYIHVWFSSESNNNPYHAGDKVLLASLYCEAVMNTKQMLLVPNALKDPQWENCPEAKIGLISYLGFPLLLPNGNVFGTICILDNKENAYNENTIDLLSQFRDLIEMHLQLLYTNNELKNAVEYKSQTEKKLAVINQSHLLINDIIRHDIVNNLLLVNGYLTLAQEEMKDNTHFNKILGAINESIALINEVELLTEGSEQIHITETVQFSQIIIEIASKYNMTYEINGESCFEIDVLLKNVLDNLIRNIHIHSGMNKVFAEIEEEEDNIIISIKDQGESIPDEIVPTLFKRKKSLKLKNGSGLGLYISKILVEEIGGSIKYSKNHPTGNVFSITLPK